MASGKVLSNQIATAFARLVHSRLGSRTAETVGHLAEVSLDPGECWSQWLPQTELACQNPEMKGNVNTKSGIELMIGKGTSDIWSTMIASAGF
jgi:hypothetical protein